MSEPLIVHSPDLHWETWESDQVAVRGNVQWKTLFSQGLTNTDGLTAGLAVIHPNEALHPHHHAPSEIYYILEGVGVMTLGAKEYAVQTLDAVFIPGDVRHGIANTGTQDLVFVYAFARDSFDEVTYHFPE